MDSSLSIIGIQTGRFLCERSLCVTSFSGSVGGAAVKNDNKHQMVMSSSPGILDGDRYHLRISLEEVQPCSFSRSPIRDFFNMEDKSDPAAEYHDAG